MSIGEVLALLRPDFPDVSISKIRFLEAEGLVEPERAASGYRKFSPADLQRLRYILAAQRDHYLPLKVIREHLAAIERGLDPPSEAGGSPRVPDSASAAARAAEARPLPPPPSPSGPRSCGSPRTSWSRTRGSRASSSTSSSATGCCTRGPARSTSTPTR
jgi:DNA-binding transcriptional MerR regulator